MKLDRNTNPDGRGKYALIKLRDNTAITPDLVAKTHGAIAVPVYAIDFGDTPQTEFFVIRLKDKFAANALMAYAMSCKAEDPEYSREILDLANKAAAMKNKQFPT